MSDITGSISGTFSFSHKSSVSSFFLYQSSDCSNSSNLFGLDFDSDGSCHVLDHNYMFAMKTPLIDSCVVSEHDLGTLGPVDCSIVPVTGVYEMEINRCIIYPRAGFPGGSNMFVMDGNNWSLIAFTDGSCQQKMDNPIIEHGTFDTCTKLQHRSMAVVINCKQVNAQGCE
jgi:hypothetical protein